MAGTRQATWTRRTALPHDTLLITTIAIGLGAAWLLGMITHRAGLSPIVGYLINAPS